MDLQTFFKEHPQVAVAFSGGVDSAYLLYAASKYAESVCAYYVKSAFQPEFELRDAERLASDLNVRMRVIPVDVLSDPVVAANPPDRCYYCKQRIFGTILKEAAADGFTVILDGTNASDDPGDRPGMRALRELKVLSPLLLCGLTKSEIRRLSKEAGLFTWDKPSYACLATRVAANESLTQEKLTATERSEDFLMGLGFTDFRVRQKDGTARLELRAEQMAQALDLREEILAELGRYYKKVTMDLEARK